jgi:hypothetical protein
MIVVSPFTGLRQGELLALPGRHVDFATASCMSAGTCRPAAGRRTPRSRTGLAASR